MDEYIQFSAKTKNEAITKACIELGVSSDQLDIQVISEGSSGFFGFGSKPAIIKVRVLKEISEDAEIEKIVGVHPGQTVLLATHAGFLRAMQCHWQNLPLSAMEEIPWVPNVSVTEVEYSNGKHQITLLGDVSFLHGDITTLNGNM